MILDVAVTTASVLLSLFVVIVFILILWYIVWEVFLKKIKFIRELIGKRE